MKDAVPRRLVLLAIMLSGASSAVRAADPLGLYVGAGVGRSEVRSNLDFGVFGLRPPLTPPFDVNGKPTGWKLILGVRPLSIIGAEAEYLDFGSTSGSASIPPTLTQGGLEATVNSHPKAVALFAVGYVPIPLPYLDVFAKAGAAELRNDVRASGVMTGPIGLPLPVLLPPYSTSGTSTRFAFGAGAQLKLAGLALRAEYERISASVGDLDMLSLDLTLGF